MTRGEFVRAGVWDSITGEWRYNLPLTISKGTIVRIHALFKNTGTARIRVKITNSLIDPEKRERATTSVYVYVPPSGFASGTPTAPISIDKTGTWQIRAVAEQIIGA